MDYKELCEGIRNPGTSSGYLEFKEIPTAYRNQLKVNPGPAPSLPHLGLRVSATVCKTNPTKLARLGLSYLTNIPTTQVAYSSLMIRLYSLHPTFFPQKGDVGWWRSKIEGGGQQVIQVSALINIRISSPQKNQSDPPLPFFLAFFLSL